jgi:hypothetical protein
MMGDTVKFDEIECSPDVAEKLWRKHGVGLDEVAEALGYEPHVRRGPDGLCYVLGRTEVGRYLFVVVRPVSPGIGLIVTARDMTVAERRSYHRR